MTVIPVTGADRPSPPNPGATITDMARLDLYAPDLPTRIAELVGTLPGVEAATVDGRRLRGPIVSLDSPAGRTLAFTIKTDTGRQPVTAAQLLSLTLIDPTD